MNIMLCEAKIPHLGQISQGGQVVPDGALAQLAVGVHQVLASEYTRAGRERTPRGRSCFSRRSALSPLARESDSTPKGIADDFQSSLMTEDGRIELHRVSPRLTALQAGCAFYVKEPMRFEGIG